MPQPWRETDRSEGIKVGKNRPKMSPADRAKQFMPFAALKGYEEALRKKELEMEEKMKRETGEKYEEDFSTFD